ncbi:hypothetical protein [Calidifontibacillus erzurumensis]|uniref:hypothetical protein n=1 Tax=Calidifontibacillus erzurumensis TaxID=2741433 RepID=UPI0035B50E32
MKLIPITLYDLPHLPAVEWRFKKKGVTGKVKYRKETKDFIYELYHPQFKVKSSLDDNKFFLTKEEAAKAAENWIDLWDAVQGRISALK